MLLYTRLAPAKVPKRRSRAGCNFCKEKKKKCDETRPKCNRCQENDHDCVYEPVKPRHRRRYESFEAGPGSKLHSVCLDENDSPQSPRQQLSMQHWKPSLWQFDDHLTLSTLPQEACIQTPPAPPTPNVGEIALYDSTLYWGQDHGTADPSESISSFDSTDSGSTSNQDDVEEVVRTELSITPPSITIPSLAMTTPAASPSPHLEFCTPAFAEFSPKSSRRILVDHFANVLSHLMVLREDEGNPFQQLVLPISQKSPAVMNAIFALSSAHLERRGVRNPEKSIYFHSQAIKGLAGLIAKGGGANRNEVLAAIIILVYYEVLVQTGRSNIVDGHLRGAMAIMNENKTPIDPTCQFLDRAFRFYDVIAALSLGSAPISPPSGHNGFAPFPPINSRGTTLEDGNADALLGMATSLWPVIHRLSTLGGLKKDLSLAEMQGDYGRAACLRTEFETTASAVELALQQWDLPPGCLTDDADQPGAEYRSAKMKKQSILNSAKAYRHSGFVYLYRTIYGCPRYHSVVQRHTHISLIHCVGTVKNGGPMGALLWPLFVASCEAIDPADRDLAREAFAGTIKRQGMTNIERASQIVEEVWRRFDDGQEIENEMTTILEHKQDLWRRVSEDMGVTVVLG